MTATAYDTFRNALIAHNQEPFDHVCASCGYELDRLLHLGGEAMRRSADLDASEREFVKVNIDSLTDEIANEIANMEYPCACSEGGGASLPSDDYCEKWPTDCCGILRYACETATQLDGAGDPDVTTCAKDYGCEPYLNQEGN